MVIRCFFPLQRRYSGRYNWCSRRFLNNEVLLVQIWNVLPCALVESLYTTDAFCIYIAVTLCITAKCAKRCAKHNHTPVFQHAIMHTLYNVIQCPQLEIVANLCVPTSWYLSIYEISYNTPLCIHVGHYIYPINIIDTYRWPLRSIILIYIIIGTILLMPPQGIVKIKMYIILLFTFYSQLLFIYVN